MPWSTLLSGSWVKAVVVPPLTAKLKSVATFVPPLSLTTTFLTMRVACLSLFVIVQVYGPAAREISEQPL
jgi:hypothetical protein